MVLMIEVLWLVEDVQKTIRKICGCIGVSKHLPR
jgi:hypothetical protein